MKISVVTPTRNKKELLRRTLESLAAQEVDRRSFEAVVVDDASDDGSGTFARSLDLPYALRVVRLDENRGRAAARNRGIEAATGDLVVFLDDDMEVVPGFLGAHAAFHAGRVSVAGVGNVRNHPGITLAPIDRYMSSRGAQKIRGRAPLPWKYFSTNNSSVQRADLAAVGGFDERFRHYGFEDLELALRLEKERGLSFHFVEEARSLHLHAHSLDDLLKKKRIAGRWSLAYFFRKHPEAKRALGYERFDPPGAGDGPWRRLERRAYRLLFTRPFHLLARPPATLPLGWFTNRCIDFLVQYQYLEGLAGARREEGRT